MNLRLINKLMIGVLAFGMVGTAAAATQEINATVTVSNTITLAKNSDLSFGSISATFDDTASSTVVAKMTVKADGSPSVVTANTPASANIIIIADGAPAEVAVSGAAPGQDLSVSVAETTVTMTDPSGVSAHTFSLQAFNFYYAENSNTFTTTTDGTGNLTIGIGADLVTTNPAGDSGVGILYDDATYTGKFNLNVEY